MSFHRNVTGGDIWVQWFKCCVTPQVPQKRRRIDRSMIGEPTNFVHLGHVGANDMQQQGSRYLNQLQTQMCSKGQYQSNGQQAVRVNS
ncbi:CDC42 small effector protein homolog [Amphibalanus amphitrite]|uniref:CDC42 small effector protein homolog n=1 Tax=Amphibalanus amphitrite TaxID=1232801 RepID=UPI001C92074F|nr:CDC42 small effector protein homolog [Amphibalanus amphitrite]